MTTKPLKYIGEIASRLEDDIFKGQESSTHIQWKGTSVCMDFRCDCGACSHFDAEFLYFIKCPNCERTFCVGSRVVVVEVLPEHAPLMKNVSEGAIHEPEGGQFAMFGKAPTP